MAVDQLSNTFAALADPTRRAILGRLAEGEATVNELAEPFPITKQAVSQHIKVLERAGLVTRTRNAQLRCAARGGLAGMDRAGALRRLVWRRSGGDPAFDRHDGRSAGRPVARDD